MLRPSWKRHHEREVAGRFSALIEEQRDHVEEIVLRSGDAAEMSVPARIRPWHCGGK